MLGKTLKGSVVPSTTDSDGVHCGGLSTKFSAHLDMHSLVKVGSSGRNVFYKLVFKRASHKDLSKLPVLNRQIAFFYY
jgi:hypothetical protein